MKRYFFISIMMAIGFCGCQKEYIEPQEAILFHVECTMDPFDSVKYAIDEYIVKVIIYSEEGGEESVFTMQVGGTRIFSGDTATQWLGRDMAVFVVFRARQIDNPDKRVPTSVSPMPQWARVNKINDIRRFTCFIGKP